MIGNGGRKLARPKTAATSTKKDEGRIKNKLKMLENIERKIEEDLEEFNNKRKPQNSLIKESGIKLTKAMLLDSS